MSYTFGSIVTQRSPEGYETKIIETYCIDKLMSTIAFAK